MQTDTDTVWASAYGNYFWAAVGLWLLCSIRTMALPLPRTFAMGVAVGGFALISGLYGLTTFMTRAIYRIDAGGRSYDSVDWRYADDMAQCLVLLQLLLWSSIRHAVARPHEWLQWALLPLILSVFYPMLVALWPPASAVFLGAMPVLIVIALTLNETRERRRGLAASGILVVLHAVVITVFSADLFDAAVNDVGLSFLRIAHVFLLASWFDFWAQSEAEYMQSCITCKCCCSRPIDTAAAASNV